MVDAPSTIGKKRKIGTVAAPHEDIINEIQSSLQPRSIAAASCTGNNDSECQSEEFLEISRSCNKVFNDPIHGHIELHPLCIKIVDTPQFQRLRHIKQLGGCYYVFPGASHNRFEHSLGVAFLAGKLCTKLKKQQPSLGITDEDILCVKIAGLCHDLGHGPFSHLYDGLFIPRAKPNRRWKHEDSSADMLEHIIEMHNLMPEFEKWNLFQEDLEFIKQLILGKPKSSREKGGRSEKSYLYEIVANKRTGVDVDKWDYFARDCYYLGISNNFDYKRYMKFARVVNVDGELQICTRDKEVGTLYDMFHTRNSLHRRAYQHKTAKIIDTMIVEALLKADPHIHLPGRNGKQVNLSDAIDDMHAFTYLTDSILHQIQVSTDPKLQEAQDILKRIECRNLYKFVGQTILSTRLEKTCTELCEEILSNDATLNADDFTVQIIEFNYGMKDNNPIDQVRFYCKDDPGTATKLRKDQVSQMLPETFAEQHLRLHCRVNDADMIQKGERALALWCEETGNTPPKGGNLYPELTPSKRKASLAEGCTAESAQSKSCKLNFDDLM